ncbi:MAG: discoidin domain-containing protein [Sedimentisphaerales bacterium]|nr:discoidin domain-containing protein [Sedimentisphaerales bacterium]
MEKRVIFLILFVAALVPANNIKADMIAYYPMDEGNGINISDATGNGNDGTITGTPEWVESKQGYGMALAFPGEAGSYVETGTWDPSEGTQQVSVTAWINWAGATDTYQGIISKTDGVFNQMRWQFTLNTGDYMIGYGGGTGAPTYLADAPTIGQWQHVAFTHDGTTVTIYVDGIPMGSADIPLGDGVEAPLNVGTLSLWGLGDAVFNGIIDDVRIFNNALNQAEIQQAMLPVSKGCAFSPQPVNKDSDVLCNVVFSWKPGIFADKHNVYLGTSYEDVESADTGSPLLAGQAEDSNSFNPGRLEFDQTYYWRVDEVNAPPDNAVYKGDIWSFTVEPYSIQISGENIIATASSHTAAEIPENTIDNSGLDADDLQSVNTSTMWVTADDDTGPAWIRYEFDKTYKLEQMLVWNYNGYSILSMYGLKEVSIDYSTDGTNWRQVPDVPEFARASGRDGYVGNITVPLGAIAAKYVKINAVSNWSNGVFNKFGLSEVRFMAVPVSAREPGPDDEATDVAIDTTLGWRAGREAAEHNIYINTDGQSIIDGTASGTTVSLNSYGPLSLDLDSTYYWRIDEVNNTEAESVWEGNLWSFTTQEYLVVDDFESYNDIAEGQTGSNLVYRTWSDGYDSPQTNGSAMGYTSGNSLETDITHGVSEQSVPLIYDNSVAGSSVVSVSTNDLPIGRDWSRGSSQTLVLWIRGELDNSSADQLFVKVNNTRVTYEGDISVPLWKQWNIELSSLGVNLTNITTLSIGLEGSGSGIIFLDDIALYRIAPEVVEPTDPGTTNLVAQYLMENNVQDSSGNGLNGTIVGTPGYVAGITGMALSLDGVDDHVNCGDNARFDITGQITLAAWVKTNDAGNGQHNPFVGKGDQSYAIKHASNNSMEFFIYDDDWQTLQSPINSSFNDNWHHIAGTFDGNQLRLYVDGLLADSMDYTGAIATTTYPVNIGRNSQNTDRLYEGAIDEVRIYNRALSEAEIQYIMIDW